jgi:hypothetical protein
MMKFIIVSAAIVIAVTSSSVGTVSAFAPSLLSQGGTKCSSGGSGGLIFLNAATLDTAAEEETKMIATATANVAVVTNGDVKESTSTAAAAAVEKAWPVMPDNFVKDSDRVLP